jgi:hypothetical protein
MLKRLHDLSLRSRSTRRLCQVYFCQRPECSLYGVTGSRPRSSKDVEHADHLSAHPRLAREFVSSLLHLISKNIVTCCLELRATWSLALRDENGQGVCENGMLSRIFGPKMM